MSTEHARSAKRYTRFAVICLAGATILTVATVAIVFYCIAELGGEITPAKLSLHGNLLRAAGVGAALSLVLVVKAAFFVFQARRLHIRELADAIRYFGSGDLTVQVAPLRVNTRGAGDINELQTNFAVMTERVAEKVLQRTLAEDSLRSSVAELSHDLRTPLALLRGYVETLLEKGESLPLADQQEYLRITLRHAAKLERLVSGLFELTELDAPDVHLECAPVALDDLIEDLIGEFALRAEAVGVRLSRQDCEGLPLVNVDARLIERVFENLIENALRFTQAGGTITIACRVVGSAVETEIRDTGEGIDPRDLPRVFDRFYRSRDSDNHRGSGLGLAIVKRILQLHGSDISVSSRPGAGSTFTFALAVVRPEAYERPGR